MSNPNMSELETAMSEGVIRRKVKPASRLSMAGEEADDEPSREKDPFPRDGSPRDQSLWERREANRRKLEKKANRFKELEEAMTNRRIGK